MKLSTRIRPFTDVELIEGRITDQQRDEWEAQVRQARVEVARNQATWEEIPAGRLVQRGRYLVDVETDRVFTRRTGVVFEPGRATIGYLPNSVAMAYYVTEHDEIVFLEHPGGPRTWSEHVARRARRT